MYLFTEYVFRESVDSAHNSQISSTFQEADCLLKLVKVNKQVFAITSLSRSLNHTAQLSISARGDIIILSVGLGGGEETEKTHYGKGPLLFAHSVQMEGPLNTLYSSAICSIPLEKIETFEAGGRECFNTKF